MHRVLIERADIEKAFKPGRGLLVWTDLKEHARAKALQEFTSLFCRVKTNTCLFATHAATERNHSFVLDYDQGWQSLRYSPILVFFDPKVMEIG